MKENSNTDNVQVNYNYSYLIRFSGDVTYRKHNSRTLFEDTLMHNLVQALKKNKLQYKLVKLSARIYLETDKEASNILSKIFGIHSFSPCNKIEFSSLAELGKGVLELYKEVVKGKKFAIRCRRTGKHDFNSEQASSYIGSLLLPYSSGVNLDNPDVEVGVEIRDNYAFVFDKTIGGPSGIPIGTGDNVLSLFSGGFDSPVASWFLAKRGCKVDFIHFAFGSLDDTIDVVKVAKYLADNWFYGYEPRMYIVQMSSFINEIMKKLVPKIWQVALRKGMYIASEMLALEKNYDAMLTGESIAQATSQTARNIRVAEEGISLPIFRPLIGLDKNEIIDFAKKIGTYELSLKVQELCSIAIGPLTPRADPEKFRKDFNTLNLDIIKEAVKNRIEIDFSMPLDEQLLKIKENEDFSINYIPHDAVIVNLMPEKMKIPNSLTLLDLTDEILNKSTVIFVCEKGLTSKGLAKHYRNLGYRTYSLEGGFEGYNKLKRSFIKTTI